MFRSRARRIVGAFLPILLVAACDPPPTGVDEEVVEDLVLSAAVVDAATLERSTREIVEAPDGELPLLSPPPSASTEIYLAHTYIGSTPREVYARGLMFFVGHAGSMTTRLRVLWEDALLGSNTARAEMSNPFAFSLSKKLESEAVVYTDHLCGLSAMADSDHRAWWEIFQGRASPKWGYSGMSTVARPLRQPDCQKYTTNRDPTGRYRSSGGIVCTYLITYDLDTLVIVDVKLLYCQTKNGSGDLM